jgi:dephospho-CoA kinase
VDSEEALQLERASQRDGQTRAKIEKIMANQLTRDDRVSRAHDVVSNNGSLDELYTQLEPLHEMYLSLAKYQ